MTRPTSVTSNEPTLHAALELILYRSTSSRKNFWKGPLHGAHQFKPIRDRRKP